MPNPFPSGLEPAPLWACFDLIRSIPHGSGNEAALRQALVEWAEGKGLAHRTDDTGNLVIEIPATPGREDRAVTVLQGHLDMVCEKNADKEFDFEKDGIDVAVDGDWLTAQGTTLGSDNGVGAAAALALVDDPEAVHGPLEVLLTVDEETGMTGAWGLDTGLVKGRRLINLDTEEADAIYVGCAGGGDVNARFSGELRGRCDECVCARIHVKGLVGGHSGLEIHYNRANAIKCLARVLDHLWGAGARYRIIRFEGGSMRNAIPREAMVALSVDPSELPLLEQSVEALAPALAAEFQATDPDLAVTWEQRPDCACSRAYTREASRRIVSALLVNPSSILSMSREVEGLVETSNNLGVIRTLEDGSIETVNCTRSSVDSALEHVRIQLRALYEMAGAEVELEDAYPGWKPDLDSPLLATALEAHEKSLGRKASIEAVHAGLECGLIGMKYPGMDMISIGPEIRGAHSPTERVSIRTVQDFYTHLKGILAALD